ncbi:MAG: iron ABC transporter permease, partial [Anaerolineaceae bacterium]|nr:iron ABC transporter permease [Anaerolineaceae bacterium]
VTDFCITFANEHDVVNLTNWSMGSFSGANWAHVRIALLVCIPGLIAAFLISKPIGAYLLSENYAASMGVSVRLFRIILLLISSLLSSCVTAIAGPISFVGIAVPHITRVLLKSSGPRFMIPAVFLSGSVFCVFSDLLARTLFSPVELKITTVTSVFGAPIVIFLMIRRRRGDSV